MSELSGPPVDAASSLAKQTVEDAVAYFHYVLTLADELHIDQYSAAEIAHKEGRVDQSATTDGLLDLLVDEWREGYDGFSMRSEAVLALLALVSNLLDRLEPDEAEALSLMRRVLWNQS